MTTRGRVVLDTDVLRFALTHPAFREQIISEFPQWALSVVVAHELRRSVRRTGAAAVEGLIRSVPVRVEPSWSDWMVAADYLSHLGARQRFAPESIPRHQNDCLIAASAWREGLPVVTCNRQDFERIGTFLKDKAGQLLVLSPP